MNDFRPLGAPIRTPEKEKPDEYEFKVVHGQSVWKNKRTGQLQTNNPVPIIPPVFNPFEHMREILKKAQQDQEDDGFPMEFYGAF